MMDEKADKKFMKKLRQSFELSSNPFASKEPADHTKQVALNPVSTVMSKSEDTGNNAWEQFFDEDTGGVYYVNSITEKPNGQNHEGTLGMRVVGSWKARHGKKLLMKILVVSTT